MLSLSIWLSYLGEKIFHSRKKQQNSNLNILILGLSLVASSRYYLGLYIYLKEEKNKTGNVLKNVILKRVCETIFAVEKE
jgi:hypothetical protein